MHIRVELAPSVDPDQCYVYGALNRLIAVMEDIGLAGYDPYDTLASPLLCLVGQRVHLLGRIGIQALRLSPINLRALLGIRPGLDAKALGLIARAYFLLSDQANDVGCRRLAAECLELLERVAVSGFGGACWAHPFPYISSRGYLPAGFPSVVSTVYAAQAFVDGYERGGGEHWLAVARSACDFILKDLARIGGSDRFCFSYHPGGELAVHNASLLAAALLARVARLTGESNLLELVRASLCYTLDDQRPDGSWPYDGPESDARANTFVDGFHTGFVLESLWDISQDAGMNLDGPIARGLQFYLDQLFEPDGQPRRSLDRLWPLDLRDCAQAIILLSRLRKTNQSAEAMRHQVTGWTVRNMQAPSGYFYYLRWQRFVTPIPYVRFQGWMMVALARYLHAEA